jgi:predicted ribosomally synthesized peptide with nif11-like leader
MSIESTRAFYSKITTDETFQNKFAQATTQKERQQILQSEGYDFTSEE